MPATTVAKALQLWQEKNPTIGLDQATTIKMIAIQPPIEKIDTQPLQQLANIRHLALSTNMIDKIPPLPSSMKCLEVLSLGRNVIKRISGLEDLPNLLELWISYNQIATLDGLASLSKLKVLHISNNKIKDFNELRKLQSMASLENVTLVGNPIYDGFTKKSVRGQVLKYYPSCKVLDGELVTEADTGVDEILEQVRSKLASKHGNVENSLVTVPDFADPTRTQVIPKDLAIAGLIAMGLENELAESAYGRIDTEKKGDILIKDLRRALNLS
jgi:dynein light chain 1, axonemal